jgi:hypothetical protein
VISDWKTEMHIEFWWSNLLENQKGGSRITVIGTYGNTNS